MTRGDLEAFLRNETQGLTTDSEAWHFAFDKVAMQAFVSEPKDRMRVMAMVALLNGIKPEHVEPILRTNFNGDARYGLQDGVLWAVYMHSLSGLRESDLISGLHQVASLTQSFGSSFSSGPMRFQWPRPGEPPGIRRRTLETVQESLGKGKKKK